MSAFITPNAERQAGTPMPAPLNFETWNGIEEPVQVTPLGVVLSLPSLATDEDVSEALTELRQAELEDAESGISVDGPEDEHEAMLERNGKLYWSTLEDES